MLISEGTKEKLNALVTASFQMNSVCDNVAYNLDYYDYLTISDVFHHRFAHKFPEFADVLTELMAKLDARATRGALSADEEDYEGNLVAMFTDIATACESYHDKIVEALELSELNGDHEVEIALEAFLEGFTPYYKQARSWATYAKRYEGDEKSFDIHFTELTKFIA